MKQTVLSKTATGTREMIFSPQSLASQEKMRAVPEKKSDALLSKLKPSNHVFTPFSQRTSGPHVRASFTSEHHRGSSFANEGFLPVEQIPLHSGLSSSALPISVSIGMSGLTAKKPQSLLHKQQLRMVSTQEQGRHRPMTSAGPRPQRVIVKSQSDEDFKSPD